MRFTVRSRSTNITNVKLLRNDTIENHGVGAVVVYDGPPRSVINDNDAEDDRVYYYRFEITTEAGLSLLPISAHISSSDPDVVIVNDVDAITFGKILTSSDYPVAATMVDLIKETTSDEQIKTALKPSVATNSRWFKSYIEGREYIIPLDDMPIMSLTGVATASRLAIITKINDHLRDLAVDVSIGGVAYELVALPIRFAVLYLVDIHSTAPGTAFGSRASYIGNEQFGITSDDAYKSHTLPAAITSVSDRLLQVEPKYAMYNLKSITGTTVPVVTTSATPGASQSAPGAAIYNTGVALPVALVRKNVTA